MLDFNISVPVSNLNIKFPKIFKRRKKKEKKQIQMIQDTHLKPKDLSCIPKERLLKLDVCYYLIQAEECFILAHHDTMIEEKYDTSKFYDTHLLKDLMDNNKYLLFKSMIKRAVKEKHIKTIYQCNITSIVYSLYFTHFEETPYVLCISFPAFEDEVDI